MTSAIRWIQADEDCVGEDHPTLDDVLNRPLRDYLEGIGIDPDAATVPLLGPVFNVLSPGTGITPADPTGVTDSSAAFQAAFDSRRPIVVGAGTFLIAGLTVTCPVHFVGGGYDTILKVISGSTAIPILIQDLVTEIPYVYFGHFKLDGNLSGQLDAGLIQCNNPWFVFEKIKVTGAGTPGASAVQGVAGIVCSAGAISSPGSKGVIRDCIGEYCTKSAFQVSTEAINCVIDSCIARYNTGQTETPGFQYNGAINCKFVNCVAHDNQGNGFVLGQPLDAHNSKYAIFDNCIAYRNGIGSVTGHGFAVLNAFSTKFGHIKFSHCLAYENGIGVNADGFNIQNYNDVELDHCEAYKNKLSGFLAASGTNIHFYTCTANHNGTAGVGGGGFLLYGLTRFSVIDCKGFDDDSVPTQQYGLIFYTGAACTDGIVRGNKWHPGNTIGTIQFIVAPTTSYLEADTTDGTKARCTPYGGLATEGVLSESITLATGAATTDSVANLLPANSLILGVTARITTTITTAVSWSLGDATTSARFTANSAVMTSGTTGVGGQHLKGAVSTDATGPWQVAAAKLRITLNANPGAGVIRVDVWYLTFGAPTS